MAKLTLTPLTSLTNEESAIAAINANWDLIEAALELTYSRNNLAPNTLSGNLDMNGFRIINSGAPVDDNDVPRLTDLVDGVVGDTGPQGDPGGPLADGDYGDVVVTGGGTVISLDSAVVTAAAKTVLDDASVSAMRTTLGLGDSATKNTGTTAGTVSAGDDARFSKFTVTAKDATGDLALNENFLYHSSGSAHTFTIQPVATIAHPVGYQIIIKNGPSGGDITLTRGAGVSMYINGATSSANGTITAGGNVTLVQYATNEWLAQGSKIS